MEFCKRTSGAKCRMSPKKGTKTAMARSRSTKCRSVWANGDRQAPAPIAQAPAAALSRAAPAAAAHASATLRVAKHAEVLEGVEVATAAGLAVAVHRGPP